MRLLQVVRRHHTSKLYDLVQVVGC
eukprot:COSAG02_NODE_41341_length_395_cov_1.395270_1_plen_24_part_10